MRTCEGNGEEEGRKVNEASCPATRCKNEVVERCSVDVLGVDEQVDVQAACFPLFVHIPPSLAPVVLVVKEQGQRYCYG